MINQKNNFPSICAKSKDKKSCEDIIRAKWNAANKKSQETEDESDPIHDYKNWLTDEEAYFLYTMSDDSPMSFEEFMKTDQKGYWTAP